MATKQIHAKRSNYRPEISLKVHDSTMVSGKIRKHVNCPHCGTEHVVFKGQTVQFKRAVCGCGIEIYVWSHGVVSARPTTDMIEREWIKERESNGQR